MPQTAVEKHRFVLVQVVRGCAAILICLHHFVQVVHNGRIEGAIPTFLWEKGPVALDFFFVLSGLVIASSVDGKTGAAWAFLVNRFVRIFPNYWFYTALLCASMFALPAGCYLTGYDPKSLFWSLLLVPNANPNGYGDYPVLYTGWSLTYEVFFYLVMYASLLAFRKRAIWSAIIVMAAMPFAFGRHHPLGQSNGILLEFVEGMLIYECYRFWLRLPTKVLWAGLTIGSAAILALLAHGWFQSWFRLLVGAWGIAVAVTVEQLLPTRSAFLRSLERIGDMTYSVYLSHIVVLGWMVALFGAPRNLAVELAMVAIFLAVTLLVSHFTFRKIETGPLAKRFKNALIALSRKGG